MSDTLSSATDTAPGMVLQVAGLPESFAGLLRVF